MEFFAHYSSFKLRLSMHMLNKICVNARINILTLFNYCILFLYIFSFRYYVSNTLVNYTIAYKVHSLSFGIKLLLSTRLFYVRVLPACVVSVPCPLTAYSYGKVCSRYANGAKKKTTQKINLYVYT